MILWVLGLELFLKKPSKTKFKFHNMWWEESMQSYLRGWTTNQAVSHHKTKKSNGRFPLNTSALCNQSPHVSIPTGFANGKKNPKFLISWSLVNVIGKAERLSVWYRYRWVCSGAPPHTRLWSRRIAAGSDRSMRASKANTIMLYLSCSRWNSLTALGMFCILWLRRMWSWMKAAKAVRRMQTIVSKDKP